MTSIPIDQIRIDGGTQVRVELNVATVTEYFEQMTEGATFPPLVVFSDGEQYWLADGFHRYSAAQRANTVQLACDIREGTLRDALLYAVGANTSHGLRHSNADKRKAVQTLLCDEEWAAWSDRKIAETCGVSHTFVSALRAQLATVSSCKDAQPAERLGSDGKTRALPKAKAPVDSIELTPLDALGREVPVDLRPIFAKRTDFGQVESELTMPICRVDTLCDDPSGLHIQKQTVAQSLRDAKRAIRDGKPHARCECGQDGGCDRCNGSGFLCKRQYDNVPAGAR